MLDQDGVLRWRHPPSSKSEFPLVRGLITVGRHGQWAMTNRGVLVRKLRSEKFVMKRRCCRLFLHVGGSITNSACFTPLQSRVDFRLREGGGLKWIPTKKQRTELLGPAGDARPARFEGTSTKGPSRVPYYGRARTDLRVPASAEVRRLIY